MLDNNYDRFDSNEERTVSKPLAELEKAFVSSPKEGYKRVILHDIEIDIPVQFLQAQGA